MRPYRSSFVAFALLATLAATLPLPARQDAPPNRLTIEVTGGDANKPVENASVYLKTVEEHRLKDKKTEVSVKTNQDGVAHIPDVPLGRVLIQVVADGWKSYGHWYDISDPKQTISIHLERPPKWY
jgi:hypothetical protein